MSAKRRYKPKWQCLALCTHGPTWLMWHAFLTRQDGSRPTTACCGQAGVGTRARTEAWTRHNAHRLGLGKGPFSHKARLRLSSARSVPGNTGSLGIPSPLCRLKRWSWPGHVLHLQPPLSAEGFYPWVLPSSPRSATPPSRPFSHAASPKVFHDLDVGLGAPSKGPP